VKLGAVADADDQICDMDFQTKRLSGELPGSAIIALPRVGPVRARRPGGQARLDRLPCPIASDAGLQPRVHASVDGRHWRA